MNQSDVQLFFSCDDNYVPFLAVTLESLRANCDQNRRYFLHILHTGLSAENIARLTEAFDCGIFTVEFHDITATVEAFSARLHTRDYYSRTTYYRLFIPDLFPMLDRALYLDSDLLVRGDIAQLYDTELGDHLAAAIPDTFIDREESLRLYATKRVGLESSKDYFNAGVLLMNLRAMREYGFQKVFLSLLDAVKFNIAQDQDYLNVICQKRTVLLGREWNTMPFEAETPETKLVHFNLDNKPWHKDGVPYSGLFWHYADRCAYAADVRRVRKNYSEQQRMQSATETNNLLTMARAQAADTAENARIHQRIHQIIPQ